MSDMPSDFLDILRAMDVEKLRIANRLICDELNHRSRMNARQFSPGDRVEWNGKMGRQIGTVTRLMQKNVAVHADTGANWRVSGSLLRLLKAA